MNCKLLITKEAKRDIDEIISYIVNELNNPAAAKNLLAKIQSGFDTVSHNPYAFELCQDKRLKECGYRKIVVNNYIIFYKIGANCNIVYIMRVIYGRRNYIDFI